jgi:hypothetical protein
MNSYAVEMCFGGVWWRNWWETWGEGQLVSTTPRVKATTTTAVQVHMSIWNFIEDIHVLQHLKTISHCLAVRKWRRL